VCNAAALHREKQRVLQAEDCGAAQVAAQARRLEAALAEAEAGAALMCQQHVHEREQVREGGEGCG